ncbi:MAG: HAD family phosphatase [Anaerolineales bacterium]|nr:HAD family phosphatase [Anaerolineales bacterium]
MKYTAILFDMDGVVIDTHQPVTAFWLALAAELGVTLSQADFQQHIYGCPMNHTFDVLFPYLTAEQRRAIFSRLEEYEIAATYTAVPGVISLLQTLRRHGFPTALVTSADTWKVDVVERQLELQGLFATRVTVGEIERGKPYPDGYLLAARRLQQPPERCLVFEDAISGVQAAVAAGTTCIGVRPPETAQALLDAGASHTIPDFSRVTLTDISANGRPASLCLQLGAEVGLSLWRLDASRGDF